MRWFVFFFVVLAAGCSDDKTNCGALCGDATSFDGAVSADGAVGADAASGGDASADRDASSSDGPPPQSDGGIVDTGRGPTRRDAGTPDALAPFDGGDVMPQDPACQQMLTCCPDVPRDDQPACYQIAADDNGRLCNRLFTSYLQLGYCERPDAGPVGPGPDAGPATCADLADCCIIRRRRPIPMCEAVATGGDEQACNDLYVAEGC